MQPDRVFACARPAETRRPRRNGFRIARGRHFELLRFSNDPTATRAVTYRSLSASKFGHAESLPDRRFNPAGWVQFRAVLEFQPAATTVWWITVCSRSGSGHHHGRETHLARIGITAILKPFRWWGNEKRRIKRKVGYDSPEVRLAIPFPIGWLWIRAVNHTPAVHIATIREAGTLR